MQHALGIIIGWQYRSEISCNDYDMDCGGHTRRSTVIICEWPAHILGYAEKLVYVSAPLSQCHCTIGWQRHPRFFGGASAHRSHCWNKMLWRHSSGNQVVGVRLYARKGHVGGCSASRAIQIYGHVIQCRALYLLDRRGIA